MRLSPDGRDNPYAAPLTTLEPVLRPGGKLAAPCPNCGYTQVKPITFTLWGGALGPRLFSHASCLNCKTKYNSKTGRSNLTAIVIYQVVGALIAVAMIIGFAMSRN